MSFNANRRRFLALAAAASLPAGRALAQADAAGYLKRNVGSWSVTVSRNQGAAVPLAAAVATAQATSADGTVTIAGQLGLDYYSEPGEHQGFAAVLRVWQKGEGAPARDARVFVDGRQVEAFLLGEVKFSDPASWYGGDLAGLQAARSIKVTVADGGDTVTAYEVNLEGTAKAMALMKSTEDRYYRIHGATPPSESFDCFLTTACCGLIGLPDDCFELTTLRRFRDDIMMATADGRADVARYYAEAPRIVAAIRRRGEERILLRLYLTHILPSALAARLGLRRTARRLYTNMMHRLAPYLAM